MKKGEFIRVSKRMVMEYFNRYVDDINIPLDGVRVIGFYNKTDGYRILLSTPENGEQYYEVIYDREQDKLDSYIYKKVEDKSDGRKNNRYYFG